MGRTKRAERREVKSRISPIRLPQTGGQYPALITRPRGTFRGHSHLKKSWPVGRDAQGPCATALVVRKFGLTVDASA